ncbi:MAG: acetate--CoA ligase family protein [Pseudomonadota bacterium]
MEKEINDIISYVHGQKRTTLSEYEGAKLLIHSGMPMAKAILAGDLADIKSAAKEIRYPVVLKACSAEVSHKTEKGLVAVNLDSEAALEAAFEKMSGLFSVNKGEFLVQEMIKGSRELVIGMIRDPQFGPCIMFGLGGIFTETMGDVTFRPAPINESDAEEMIEEIKGRKILDAVRGMPAVDIDSLIHCLMVMNKLALGHENIEAIDINPLIIRGNKPFGVDALVILR